MDIQGVSTQASSSSGSASSVQAAAPQDNSQTASVTTNTPADSVDLSAQAQQVLANPPTASTPAAPYVGKYDSQFTALSAVITDTTGQYTQDQQLQAFNAFMTLNSNSGTDSNGIAQGATNAQLAAVNGSSIGLQASQLQQQMAASIGADIAATTNGTSTNTTSKFYNSLSSFQQNIVFQNANMKLPNQTQLFSDSTQYGAFLASPDGAVPPPTKLSLGISTAVSADPVTALANSVLSLFKAMPLVSSTDMASNSSSSASANDNSAFIASPKASSATGSQINKTA